MRTIRLSANANADHRNLVAKRFRFQKRLTQATDRMSANQERTPETFVQSRIVYFRGATLVG